MRVGRYRLTERFGQFCELLLMGLLVVWFLWR